LAASDRRWVPPFLPGQSIDGDNRKLNSGDVGLQPYAALLLSCARTRVDAATSAQIVSLVQRDIPWVPLLQLAHSNGVLSLLYANLRAVCPDNVPPAIMARLRLSHAAAAQHNALLTDELLRLLDLFHSRGIQAVTFKGPALAATAFGDVSLRHFNDLDILLPEGDILRQKDLLMSAGYSPEYRLSAAAFRRVRYGLPFVREDGKVSVDLHWGIELHRGVIPRLYYSSEYRRLWEHLRPVVLAGREIETLGPEDTLLLLALHGAKHTWESLKMVCDIAELVRSTEPLHWDQVVKQGDDLRAGRMLFLALFLAHDLLGTALPELVLARIQADSVILRLADRIRGRLFQEARLPTEYLPIIEPLHLAMMENPWDRIRYCVQIVMSPSVEDWLLFPLPERLFPLYSVVRPLRLAGKYGLQIWQRRFKSVPTRG
jgi:hypothetical protein